MAQPPPTMQRLLLETETSPFDLSAVHSNDTGADPASCITINVGLNELGHAVKSLRHVARETAHLLSSERDRVKSATKLYVVGEWRVSFDVEAAAEEAFEEAGDPWTVVSMVEDDERALEEEWRIERAETVTREEFEWGKGVGMLAAFLGECVGLVEVSWLTTLPFPGHPLLTLLPAPQIKRLILDLRNPVSLDVNDFNRPSYVKPENMKALTRFTQLDELRIFGMHDSLQSIVWETVFRNQNKGLVQGMRVLELTMAAPPIVRVGEWVKGADVGRRGMLDAEAVYRGTNGRGILSHAYGTGEYLDDYCMRRARIASGLTATALTRPLPLLCLRLDGFVLDSLPFEQELANLLVLICGEECVDAGMGRRVQGLGEGKMGSHSGEEWRKGKGKGKVESEGCYVQWPGREGVMDMDRGRDGEESGSEGSRSEGSSEGGDVFLDASERFVGH